MSSIGPGNIGAVNIASSLAGTQKNNASQTNSAKAESASRQFNVDLANFSEKAQDVGQTDLTPDRDADGHEALGHHAEPPPEETTPEEESAQQQTSPQKIPRGEDFETGRVLDLEA